MDYFSSSPVTVFMPLWRDRVPDGFALEGDDHPRLVFRREPTAGEMREVRAYFDELGGKDATPDAQARLVIRKIAILVHDIKGDWTLYSHAWRPVGAQVDVGALVGDVEALEDLLALFPESHLVMINARIAETEAIGDDAKKK